MGLSTNKLDTKIYNKYVLKEDMVLDVRGGDEGGLAQTVVANKGDSFYLSGGYYYSKDSSILIQSTNSSRVFMEYQKNL